VLKACLSYARALHGLRRSEDFQAPRISLKKATRPADILEPMTRWSTAGLLFVGAIAVFPLSARSATFTGGAGSDYQTGPRAQSYRSALLFGSAETEKGDLTLAGIRYGDSRLGPGIGLFANGSAALSQHVSLRVVGLRTIGDESYRAWRWRAGPEFKLASDVTLGTYYLRITDNAGGSFASAGVELAGPVARNVTGQVGSSYGRWNHDVTTTQGTVSGTWHPLSRILFLGEVDVGRNLTTTSVAGPGAGGGALGGLPLPGDLGKGNGQGQGQSETASEFAAAGQIGIRFLIH